jgi:DNA-binding transcriptional MocR family regulator
MSFHAALGEWRLRSRPLAESFASAVRDAVLSGRIPVGSAMPSERAIASDLALSRGTVVAGLMLLRETGWVHTRHGSGSVVRLPSHMTARTAPWSLDHGGDVEIDLTRSVTSAPHEAYVAASRRAVERLPGLLVDAGTADAGLPRLRELIADRYTSEGLPTTPDQILVTTGAMASLILLAERLHDRGRPVVVESPTFPGALAALHRHRSRLVSLPVTGTGWDNAEHVLRTSGADLAYLTPDFHNPTGTVMSDEQRAEIAQAADRHQVTVVVDETLRDLDLRTPPAPARHLSGRGMVIVASTSKVIWSGLRVGWLRATPRLVRELLLNPLHATMYPPPLEQLIAVELLSDLDGVLAGRRAQLRAQRDHLTALLAERGWTFDVPPGGLTLWARPPGETGPVVANRARSRGVAVSPGPQFAVDRTLADYVRLPFTAPPDVLTKAVERL